MNKILRLSLANIKKHKKESILLMILIVMGTSLLSASVSTLIGIRNITPSQVESSGCFENHVYFYQDKYSDRYLEFLNNDPRVESYDHTSLVTDIIKVKNYADTEDDMLVDMSFVPESGEKRIEDFVTDADFSSAEHPIVLDITNKEKMELEVGDNFTITWNGKEFTFTVAGFYDSGLWIYGTKAVVNEEDFAFLENVMERYEMVGISTVYCADNKEVLKDFKAFAEDVSVNDLTSAVNCYSYEEICTMNEINMSVLSVIMAVMAGIMVIAVMIMIRFRIISDIKEQIVSIGVLEAMGYTPGEVALSYGAEYVLICVCAMIIATGSTFVLAKSLLKSAAMSVSFGGNVSVPIIPVIICMFLVLAFVAFTALGRSFAVRKISPVLAFRKGIENHHFRKNRIPLEKTGRSIHVRLALKEFLQSTGNIGLIVCITACTVMTVLSFMIGIFFINPDNILKSVCGHELCDIRIEAVGSIDPESFAAELSSMSGVEKVLLPAVNLGVRADGSDSVVGLEVYDDYGKTSYILVTEGRLPEHENEAALSVQEIKALGIHVGDTVTLEYGKVKRDYLVTGIVNSAVNPVTAYLTTDGFKRMDPAYSPSSFDIYLTEDTDVKAFADILKQRYGKEIFEYKNGEVTGDTLEEKIISATNIKMAEAMEKSGVSYMEYAVRIGDRVITGSTSAMKIRNMTFVMEENSEIADMLCVSFAGIMVIMMIISGVIVTIILSILMTSTVRKQYRDLGIMKSMGYTSRELRFQMAFRIVPAVVIAVAIGDVLSLLLMQVVDSYVCKVDVSAVGTMIMDAVILAFCFISAYISSAKIKKISVYELITE
jgi:ABC-type antimicrobial peptide transport system permease subunit